MITPDELMKAAIDACHQGLAAGQSPFGCAIAQGDRLLAASHNTVMLSTDITAHAEINALRIANQAAAAVHLPGAMVATTCEPCPMCMSALHWARVEKVYYGASIAHAQQAGFNELTIPATQLLAIGGSSVQLAGGKLAEECRELFDRWLDDPNRQPY